ncbi:ran-binding protein 3 isoform X2 [Prorops nasuta]|uniref:ran-binding protein 3 isoform X2 n=1 Tax=Prorops nasuta TaxID=863751 RepID=UPI0034CD1973
MADCRGNDEETKGPQAPIIVNFSAAEEPQENSANEKMEGNADENTDKNSSTPDKISTKIHRPVLTASRFGNSFGVNEFCNSSKSKPGILRPSQLGSASNNVTASSKMVLQPAKFQNPFTKVNDNSIIEDNVDIVENKKSEDATKEDKSELKPVEDIKPKFLPLGANTKDSENSVNTVTPSASTPSFVFGQNLKERVTVSKDTESSESLDKEDEESEKTNENGSSELLFSTAAAAVQTSSRPGLTLTQAAQELEEANRASKRKYSQVTLLTGEEGETNVLQINCKLFAFDKATSSWQERGRGTLRLNDRDEESRLVGRTAGTQRLILNTKVWPGMTAERAGPKSLRLTAMDVHGDVRIFIVQAAPKEIDQLHYLLLQRLKRAEERQPKKLATDH